MKHIKYFEEKASYDSYINSSDAILPNVSYVEDVNEVFYNVYINNELPNNVIRYYSDQKVIVDVGAINERSSMPSIISHEFNNGIGIITFSEDITFIDDYFSRYTELYSGTCTLTKIELPASVVKLGKESLRNLYDLRFINLTNIIYIDELVFCSCNNLTDVTINKNCEFIGFCAFSDTSVSVINYEGTMEQFMMMKKSPNWHKNWDLDEEGTGPQQIFTVRCSDGDIDVSDTYDEGYYDEGYDEGYYE